MDKQKQVQNILIVALNDNFGKRVTSFLAEKLEMFVLDCHDMLVYDLINPKEVIEKCGLEYFKKRERDVMKNCSSFLNTCISINYDLIIQYSSLFENSLIFYIDLPYDKIVKIPNIIDYENRNQSLKKIADETIKIDKKSVAIAVEKIIKRIGDRYENC